MRSLAASQHYITSRSADNDGAFHPKNYDDADDRPRLNRSGRPRMSPLFIFIIVLAGVIFVSLIVITFLCVRRRRKRKRAMTIAAVPGGTTSASGAVATTAGSKRPEDINLEEHFSRPVEWSRGATGVAEANGGVEGGPSRAGDSTLMPMEFFAPGPGSDRVKAAQ
ncbi:hypothetical protein BJY04DRAFT_224520 [Aspergillus karnatakaensis]|uniref:uncharacterized protein n=1 Tax=Aspergillus karnatakaensis TaxID=1810916 RepID=UPI003CCD01EF